MVADGYDHLFTIWSGGPGRTPHVLKMCTSLRSQKGSHLVVALLITHVRHRSGEHGERQKQPANLVFETWSHLATAALKATRRDTCLIGSCFHEHLDVEALLLPPHLPADVPDSRQSLAKHNRVLLGEAARHIWCSQERAEGLHEDMKVWSVTQDKKNTTPAASVRDTRLGSAHNTHGTHVS